MECEVLHPTPLPLPSHSHSHTNTHVLPTLTSPDYYTIPTLTTLASNPTSCSKVIDFTIGRVGYGEVRFITETDVRGLDLDNIVKFSRNEVVVYEDESEKPCVGVGLNKPAVVTLFLELEVREGGLCRVEEKLRESAERQGARFIEFDGRRRLWRFEVEHFSRFGLSLDDEDDIVMDEVDNYNNGNVGGRGEENEGEEGEGFVEGDYDMGGEEERYLSHSLPAHLGLDPVKMREMQMVMFSGEGEDEEEENEGGYGYGEEGRNNGLYREKSPLVSSEYRLSYKPSQVPPRKTPVGLLEYKSSSFDVNAPGTVLMSQQNKGVPMRVGKALGFRMETQEETPVSGYHSRNIVDAGLFMGRSFRVGWGPNGVLVHCGAPVGSDNRGGVLSSVITLEKVALDKVVRDESGEVKKEAVDLLFDTTLELHKSVDRKIREVEFESSKLRLQKLVCDRFGLPDICRSYIDVIEKQLEVPSLSADVRMSLMHQVAVWELIKVLFSKREANGRSKLTEDEQEEDMMQDGKASRPEIETEALPLVRRAEFSYWLQECVYHRVQENVGCLNDSSDLEHIFFLLTGRQLDAAVEVAASRGDVRLACLLSEAGGSMVNRADIAQQLDLWRMNGMDFNFIEKGRIRLYELLSGDIHGALVGKDIDWKRFLGLLMWYELPPGTFLPAVFQTYQHLLNEGKAPSPVPVYIDEGMVNATADFGSEGRYDLAYYLMLLHANEDSKFDDLKTMFSASASTSDPLDYHMIWHQRAILEAIGAFNSSDLHNLDMAYVSQLLCLGKCHWAIYVVLHMSYRADIPLLHSSVIKEILFRYCDIWSAQEEQKKFIEDLGVPSGWLHEALAVYSQYYGDLPKALEHYLECANWQKAHSIFITSVVHSLYLSGNDSEVWRLSTSMEDYKSEIEDWDLGAGIYISFYLLRSSLQGDENDMTKLESLETKDAACKEFFDHLNKSLEVLETRLPKDARVAYSKMSEEICTLLLSDNGEGSTREIQLGCFDTVAAAPIPEDLRSCHLQDAVSLFTCYLMEQPATS